MKLTLGVYGPKPPEESGIAGYTNASLSSLSDVFDVTHIGNEDGDVDPQSFDCVLYHLGNNPLNKGAFRALRRRKGPILLHEYINLHYYFNCWDELPGRERRELFRMYVRELDADRKFRRSVYGTAKYIAKTLIRGSERTAPARYQIEQVFGSRPDIDPSSVDIGIEGIVIEQASCVLVHSQAVLDRLTARYPGKRFVRLPFAVDPLIPGDPAQARSRFGLRSDGFLFATMGFGGKYKRLEAILDAWETWPDRPADATLCVIGKPQPGIELSGRSGVVPLGFVSDEDFEALLLAVDCGIQLRYPSIGETSAVVSRFVSNGMAVILSDIPEMHDYERIDGVSFVPTGLGERDGLVEAMKSSYARGRQTPQRQAGYDWSDWAATIVPVLMEKV